MTTTTNLRDSVTDLLAALDSSEPHADDWINRAIQGVRDDLERAADPPSVATVVALAQTFESYEQQADRCSGFAHSDPDVPAPLDSDEAENYGAAQAWGEAAAALRRALGETSGEPFDRTAKLATAEALLRSVLADEGGAGSDSIVATIVADALTCLCELTEEGAPATDLLDAARRMVDQALDGRSAAVSSLIIDGFVSGPGVTVNIGAEAVLSLVNKLYGLSRRVR